MQGKNNPNWNSIDAICDQCGAPITVIPFAMNSFQRHFCNIVCSMAWLNAHQVGANHPNWTGGEVEYYGPNWQQQKRAARSRDKKRCQYCGVTAKKLGRELDVHHIRPFRTFGYVAGENDRYLEANRLENLISLCPSCHKRAECRAIPLQPYLL